MDTFNQQPTMLNKAGRKLQLITGLILLWMLLTPNCFANEESIFLITGNTSDITTVSKHNIRKIYLGYKPDGTSNIAHPVINSSNKQTYRLFLKNIMFMTEKGYKRKVIKRIFRQGGNKIPILNNLRKLDQHFKIHPNDISFISESDIKHMVNIKVIQRLW